MKLRSIGASIVGAFFVVACSSGVETGEPGIAESSEAIIGPSTPGGRNEVVMLFGRIPLANGGLGTRTCSGSYFAPRVVVTAAHCLAGLFNNELYVYHGDNFEADVGQLIQPNGLWQPPAPGQPSFWAKADSYEAHPAWTAAQKYPDIGVVYLDRKLPFDPLPLSRTPLAANRQVTISGWGANSAPTPTTGAGGRVQRTGTTRTLGSPTIADYHADDPNPGLLTPANLPNLMKIDGTPPNANACFGDSGSPILITENGQTYIAGVDYFGGLSCLEYSLYVRINPFLPFLDQAYMKGGQAPLKPVFDCVAPNPQGGLTAFFGYDNDNGVAVTVPYGVKNSLARDTTSQRPSRFLPGEHHYAFGIDFTSGQTVTWTLSPENSPTTTLNVNQNSKRCGAAEFDQAECGIACRASQRSGCPFLPSFEQCVNFCVEGNVFQREFFPQCTAQNTAVNVCTAGVAPTPASNWECFDGFGAFALAPCAAQFDALNLCFSGE